MAKGICNLCKREKDLIKKSHIIPDCMYQELYDDNHKINQFAPTELLAGKGYIKRPSTGEYEGGILCAECENQVLSHFESYGCEFFYSMEIPIERAPKCQNYITKEGQKFSECTNVNYTKLKLFLLSIIWRASISSRDFFSEVDLGEHEEKIRQMILSGEAREKSDYPIMMAHFIKSKTIPSDITIQPIMIKKEGLLQFMIVINGMIFIFHIEGETENIFDEFTLENNRLRTYELSDEMAEKWIKEYIGFE